MPLIEAQPDAVAMTYARSLFHVLMAQGGQPAVEAAQGQLEDVLELARADRKFGEFLSSRIIPEAQRTKSLAKIFEGKLSPTTLNFIQVLNEKGRLPSLPAVVEAFVQHVQKAFGRVEVDVYTATALEPNERADIQNKLSHKLGKQVVLHAYVDPTMLGGVRFQIGDQLLDGSIKTQLARLRDQLTTRGAATVRATADKFFKADPSSNGH